MVVYVFLFLIYNRFGFGWWECKENWDENFCRKCSIKYCKDRIYNGKIVFGWNMLLFF